MVEGPFKHDELNSLLEEVSELFFGRVNNFSELRRITSIAESTLKSWAHDPHRNLPFAIVAALPKEIGEPLLQWLAHKMGKVVLDVQALQEIDGDIKDQWINLTNYFSSIHSEIASAKTADQKAKIRRNVQRMVEESHTLQKEVEAILG